MSQSANSSELNELKNELSTSNSNYSNNININQFKKNENENRKPNYLFKNNDIRLNVDLSNIKQHSSDDTTSNISENDEFYFLHPMSQLSARKKQLLKRQMIANAYGVDLGNNANIYSKNSKKSAKNIKYKHHRTNSIISLDSDGTKESDNLNGLLQINTINPKSRKQK